MLQLDFFRPNTAEGLLKDEVEDLKKSHHKLRKSTFAHLADQAAMCMKLQEEIEGLRAMLVTEYKM